MRHVLALNAGSSSLKFAVYPFADAAGDAPVASGKIRNFGRDDAVLSVRRAPDLSESQRRLGKVDAAGGLQEVLAWCSEVSSGPVSAVGHRIVHSGPHLHGPVLINDHTIERLRAMEPYDPAHQALELAFIEAVRERWPGVPQVACFDTTFHRTLPAVARRLPVSRADAERGLHRYGFHGLSYTHALEEACRTEPDAAAGRIVIAHLGSGASLAAINAGRCVDTTMGFTPTGGIPMSGRSGDVDPGVFLWLWRNHQLSAEAIFEQLTRRSGLLAVSETTADLGELLERESTDSRAAEAVIVFCHHVRKTIGAFAAVMGGLDLLVFTGGIGEHQPPIRARVCDNLDFLGVTLDAERNAAGHPVVSTDDARVRVRIIAADEERIIARAVRDVLSPPQDVGGTSTSQL